ncbi:type IIL restriction-modification enzyme MmeI [Methylopila sp. Yamaguchi]|uniref:type IIL restriction-modification enzyme MmeI n=1 Tax=Methylopila sp. Yamaguchi TaxID=1437817 RepID=UPI004037C784
MAIPDHPWTKAARDSAAVRIAMTVAEAGLKEGALREVVREEGLATDAPLIELSERRGRINADLTIGADVGAAKALLANGGLSSPGVKLHGQGFVVSTQDVRALGVDRRPGLAERIAPYRNGRDLTARPRDARALDLYGFSEERVRRDFPEAYQHLAATVKVDRAKQHAMSPTKDAADYLARWWIFGKPRPDLRDALVGLSRYVVTVETSKHRVFQFLDGSVLPDNMLVAVATDSAVHLGVLSSRIHAAWASVAGATLEDRPRYSKSRCFDPFPFPHPTPVQAARIAAIAEELDAHRKRVLDERPKLTLTGLYNVLERLRGGATPSDLTPAERRVFDEGLVLILKELHDRLDLEVAGAYGWPADLPA